MQCPECGREYPDGNRYCGSCGISLAEGGQPAQPASPPAAPQPSQPPQQQAQQDAPPQPTQQYAQAQPAQQPVYPVAAERNTPTNRRGCWGCAIALAVIFLLLACASVIGLGWLLGWYEELGLVDSPAEELFAGSRDPWAAENILLGLEENGIATEGLSVYVMPSESGGTFAYLVADESKGFRWTGPTFDNAIEGLLMFTAASETAETTPIDRVAVEYKDAEGEQVAIMTGPTQAFIDYATGEISKQELFDQMNGRAGQPSGITLGGE